MSLRLFLSTLAFLVPMFAQATKFYSRDQSYICDPAALKGHDVLCCDTLPGKTCEETLDLLLTQKQRTFLQDLTQAILDLPAYKTAMPSCFATSVAIAGFPLKDPFAYDGDKQFRVILQTSYIETYDSHHLQKGDLLIFEERGDYFDRDEDEKGRKVFKWVSGSDLSHAMYYLGQGLVVQKENASTAVSTVSTLQRSFERYSQGVAETQDVGTLTYSHKKTRLYLRIFHPTDQ